MPTKIVSAAACVALACLSDQAAGLTVPALYSVSQEDCASLSGGSETHPILRSLYYMASADGSVDFTNSATRRLVSIECRGPDLQALMYDSALELRLTLPLTRVAYASSTTDLPGSQNKELIEQFVETFNAGLNNGTRLRIAFFFEVDEARAQLGELNEMYYIGLVDGSRGMISFARVIMSDDGYISSVTVAGAGSKYAFCQNAPDGLNASTPDAAISCEASRLLVDAP